MALPGRDSPPRSGRDTAIYLTAAAVPVLGGLLASALLAARGGPAPPAVLAASLRAQLAGAAFWACAQILLLVAVGAARATGVSLPFVPIVVVDLAACGLFWACAVVGALIGVLSRGEDTTGANWLRAEPHGADDEDTPPPVIRRLTPEPTRPVAP